MATVTAKRKSERRIRRKRHIRHHVNGSPARPRLSIYKSLAHMYAQLIDDVAGRTLCAASTQEKELKAAPAGTGNCKAAEAVGLVLAERAKAAGITKVVFDRNGFKFHGRVKSLAEGARKGGLEF